MSSLNNNLAPHRPEFNRQFRLLVQALSGVRALTHIDTKNTTEKELLDQILDAILSYMDLETCSIFFLKENKLVCAAGMSWNDYFKQGITDPSGSMHEFKIGEGIIGKVAETRTSYHCRDCETDKNFSPLSNQIPQTKNGSLISAPMLIGDDLLGVLNISHPEKDFFHTWHENTLMTHACLIAHLLKNYRMMHSMDTEIKTRTTQLEQALEDSERLKHEYEKLSYIDPLTKLHNRRYFFPELLAAIATAIKKDSDLSLLIMDLDHFKNINDNYGHEVGDMVLIDVSQNLQQQIRKGDLLARFGGEEFVLALINTDIEGAEHFADRLRESIRELEWETNGEKIKISMSIGVASLNGYEENFENILNNMLRDADTALYQSKKLGRNRTQVATPH